MILRQANKEVNGRYIPGFTYDQLEKLLKIKNKNYNERLQRQETVKKIRDQVRKSSSLRSNTSK
jgi:predicted metal-dependent hydrolase